MKKIFLIFVSLAFILPFTGCQKKAASSGEGKITVLATVFPLYDWAKNLAGESDSVYVDLLLKDGVDLHSYQPSASDIVKISTADIFIYVGGESDFWVENALKNAANDKMLVINLMELLKGFVKQEEIVEGMQEEEVHHGGENLGEEEESEYDEHVWLSLNNAIASSNEIARALMEKDEEKSQFYMANLVSYVDKLSALKQEYSSSFADKTIIVCDRFPFRYLVDEFGIRYFAAFAGCSAESEASFETIAFLSNKAKELAAAQVFVTESADKKIAKTVVSSSGLKNCEIKVLDSMQSTTYKQAQKGADYLAIMRENLEALRSN
ncbi:MAG: zinc ABC transporter substrate-binding protein [Treponema sp.]|nr:zinc ABC transporter substrate-binding protein [Treponema sp.]